MVKRGVALWRFVGKFKLRKPIVVVLLLYRPVVRTVGRYPIVPGSLLNCLGVLRKILPPPGEKGGLSMVLDSVKGPYFCLAVGLPVYLSAFTLSLPFRRGFPCVYLLFSLSFPRRGHMYDGVLLPPHWHPFFSCGFLRCSPLTCWTP